MTRKDPDPITLEILWNNLNSIADECFITLMRSAFSTNIKERHDHSTAITDASGNLIAQAEHALPIHLASMAGLVAHILDRYDGDINEGDIFISNDPHVAGGTHLPDINMAIPVFNQGRLVGFVANIVHHADVGGAMAGSMSGGMDEIYKEGLRIPIVKLYHQGVVNDAIMRILLLNMRLPEERKGDLNAQIAACRLGVARLKDIIQRYGADYLEDIYAAILDRSRQRMETAIEALPDGTYRFEDMMDDDGIDTLDILIAVDITKKGKNILFDFSRSASQVAGNFNLTFNATQSAVCYSLKALLDPEMPNNSGIFQAIDITVLEGSFLNCVAPAGVALRANTCQRVVDVVIGAFADVLPSQVIGAANGANTSAVFAGVNPETGQRYVYLETLGGGMGARATKDGKDGVQVNITNTSNLPVEAIEMEYPLRVEAYALVEDSGGAGEYRGGLGIRRTIRPVGHICEFNGVGERFRHQPWGVFGGQPGSAGRFYFVDENGEKRDLPSMTGSIKRDSKTALFKETPGAGGYGNPENRSSENREEDRRSGKFSHEYLAKNYPMPSQ
ncbi:MAG: hydantoinase B/oxoprolinase family protein [Alphaproteobacteria bacterium]